VKKGIDADDEAAETENCLAKYVVKTRTELLRYTILHRRTLKAIATLLLVLLYHTYLIAAVNYNISREIPIDWCDGLGFLIVLTGIVYWSLLYYFVLKRLLGHRIKKIIFVPSHKIWSSWMRKW
jgi:membrane protein CcdC involved in cytochrome C biogenesis